MSGISLKLKLTKDVVFVQNNYQGINYYPFVSYQELKELQSDLDVGCWKVKRLK